MTDGSSDAGGIVRGLGTHSLKSGDSKTETAIRLEGMVA
jgi:hypothetical protein